MKHNTWWAIAAILIQTLFLMLMNTSIIGGSDLSSLKEALPFLNLGLVVMCIFNLFIVKKIEAQTSYQVKNLLLSNHLHQMEGMVKSLEIQQHDYSKHMQTIQALLELDKMETAKEYINGIATQYRPGNSFYDIDHPGIAALIKSKSGVAQVNRIAFAVSVKCDLSGMDIPIWDLCSILGNLLDNAIEAAAADAQPRVGVEFKYEDGGYAIYIINNGGLITEPSRICEAGYSTKGSVGRGYGLYIANKLINKHKGSIEIISKPKTTIILRLPGVDDYHDKRGSLKYG